MPARVRVPHRIIAGVAVPVQALGVARLRHDGVRLDEAPERGVVVACHFAGERAEADGRGGEGTRGRSGLCRSGLWRSEIGKVRGG